MHVEDAQEIKERMLQMVDLNLDKREGSFLNDLFAPIAIELEEAQNDRNMLLDFIFPQRSFGEFLDMSCEASGVCRKKGTKAKGIVTFYGDWYTPIPEGTQLKSKSGLLFETVAGASIKPTGEVDVPVRAVDIGSDYNILDKEIESALIEIKGVKSVTNKKMFEEGSDYEPDNELIERFLFLKRNPPNGGNIADYERWAKQVDGVFVTNVKPLWKGNGTVKVIIGGLGGEPVGEVVVNKVQTLLDPNKDGSGGGLAPIGATVTVVSIAPKEVKIEISNLVLEEEYTLEEVKKEIQKQITKYFEEYRNSTIRIKELESILINVGGVLDFDTLKLNNDTKNLSFKDDERGVLKEINYV